MFNGFFKSAYTADQLLSYVINANWKEVNKIASQAPDLMFCEGRATDINGKDITTTPLAYALHVLDMFTLNIFQRRVSNADEDKFYETRNLFLETIKLSPSSSIDAKREFNAMAEKWLLANSDVNIEKMREFLQAQTYQSSIDQRCFNMQPFYWVYEFLMTLHPRPMLENETINEFWKKIVGWAQWHLLPRHMLKQLFAGANYVVVTKMGEPDIIPENIKFKNILLWSQQSEFAHLDYHFPIDVINFSNKFNWDDGSACNQTIGNDFALARGTERSGEQRMVHIWAELFYVSSKCARDDLAIFKHLVEIRYQQVAQLEPGFMKRLWNTFMTVE